MYKMPEFTETESEEIQSFIEKHEFITLIGNDGVTSVATQVPVLVFEREGELYLRGHVMRKTDHHLAFEKNPEVLVLFSGGHCYVSSSWYTDPNVGGTWNYMTVHVRGAIQWLDESETRNILEKLTDKYEIEQEEPALFKDIPESYLDKHVKAIAGFEIMVRDMHAIFKLSQNRDDESYRNIVTNLWLSEDFAAHEIADEMVKRRPHIFNT